MSALSNAERQRRYRARKRNGGVPGAQVAAVTPPMSLDGALEHRRAEAVCGLLNPYVLFCCRVRFGPDWLRSVGFSDAEAEAEWRRRDGRAAIAKATGSAA